MEFDFSQPVTDINKVPQDFRGLYVEADGKYTINAAEPTIKSAVSAITGLNTALKAARAEAKAKAGQQIDLSPLKDYGDAPDTIAAKIQETIDGLKGQIKGVNVDKIKSDLASEWTGKLTAADTKAKALEQHLHTELVTNRAVQAIAAAEGEAELLLPFVSRQLKTGVDSTGKYQVHVVDGAGDIRYSGVTGAPMSIAELVAEMKANEKYGRLFKSETPSGGGAEPGAAARPGGVAAAAARNQGELSPQQKISAALKAGSRR